MSNRGSEEFGEEYLSFLNDIARDIDVDDVIPDTIDTRGLQQLATNDTVNSEDQRIMEGVDALSPDALDTALAVVVPQPPPRLGREEFEQEMEADYVQEDMADFVGQLLQMGVEPEDLEEEGPQEPGEGQQEFDIPLPDLFGGLLEEEEEEEEVPPPVGGVGGGAPPPPPPPPPGQIRVPASIAALPRLSEGQWEDIAAVEDTFPDDQPRTNRRMTPRKPAAGPARRRAARDIPQDGRALPAAYQAPDGNGNCPLGTRKRWDTNSDEFRRGDYLGAETCVPDAEACSDNILHHLIFRQEPEEGPLVKPFFKIEYIVLHLDQQIYYADELETFEILVGRKGNNNIYQSLTDLEIRNVGTKAAKKAITRFCQWAKSQPRSQQSIENLNLFEVGLRRYQHVGSEETDGADDALHKDRLFSFLVFRVDRETPGSTRTRKTSGPPQPPPNQYQLQNVFRTRTFAYATPPIPDEDIANTSAYYEIPLMYGFTDDLVDWYEEFVEGDAFEEVPENVASQLKAILDQRKGYAQSTKNATIRQSYGLPA